MDYLRECLLSVWHMSDVPNHIWSHEGSSGFHLCSKQLHPLDSIHSPGWPEQKSTTSNFKHFLITWYFTQAFFLKEHLLFFNCETQVLKLASSPHPLLLLLINTPPSFPLKAVQTYISSLNIAFSRKNIYEKYFPKIWRKMSKIL